MEEKNDGIFDDMDKTMEIAAVNKEKSEPPQPEIEDFWNMTPAEPKSPPPPPPVQNVLAEKEREREEETGGRVWFPVLTSSVIMIIACVVTLIVSIYPILSQFGVAGGVTHIISPVINAGEPKAMTNVLVVGVDKDGYRTDTMMIATYDNELDKVYVMQLPRDTYVENNGRSGKKLNSAFYSGVDQIKREILIAYGIKVDKYVKVELDGFKEMIDAIGGVEMDVPINMFYNDPEQDFHIWLRKGVQILDGDKAEQFVRFRKNDDGSGYPMGDLQRMEAQRDFLKATMKQLVSVDALKNVEELVKIGQENIETDLTYEEIYDYAVSVITVGQTGIEFVDAPGEATDWPTGSYFVVDYITAEDIARTKFYATDKEIAKLQKIDPGKYYVAPTEEEEEDEEEEEETPVTRPQQSTTTRPAQRPSANTGEGSSVSRGEEEETPSADGAMRR